MPRDVTERKYVTIGFRTIQSSAASLIDGFVVLFISCVDFLVLNRVVLGFLRRNAKVGFV